MTYDSTAETLKHSLRVGALMGAAIKELTDRSVRHDLSKTEDPELGVFNEYTPKLKDSTYGSDEYKGFLEAAMLLPELRRLLERFEAAPAAIVKVER